MSALENTQAPTGAMSRPLNSILYEVRVLPQRHEIEVTMTIEGPAAQGIVHLETPTWVPGDYVFAPYARDVFGVTATAGEGGARLAVKRHGLQGYRVEGAEGRLRIRYTAYCGSWEASEACGIIDDRVAVLTGARYLNVLAADGPLRVAYQLPDGWEIHHPAGAREVLERTWEYPSYEVLLDTPVAMGDFTLMTREVNGTPFHHVFLDRPVGFEARIERFIDDVGAVASYFHDIFGSFPFEHYTFFSAGNPNAEEWGLEHLTSTMVGLGPDVFTDDRWYATGVRVCAHELFHAWNVRRLRPAPLKRLDFQGGSFTEGLWVAEGFTRYYEFLSCTRTGVYSPEQFLSTVVNYYRHLSALPSYERVTPVDASLATFLNHTGGFPGRVNNTSDYYDAGMVIAFCADGTLRRETAGGSLDTVFPGFYERFVGSDLGYTPEDLRDYLDEVHPGLGQQVYREATHCGSLTLQDQLERLGFAVEIERLPYLGLVLRDDTGPAIYGVLDTSPAGQTGIAPGDVVTDVEGRTFELETLKWAIANSEHVSLAVRRGNEKHVYEIPVGGRRHIERIRWVGSDEQARRISTWVGHAFSPAKGEVIPLDFYENFHGVETVI